MIKLLLNALLVISFMLLITEHSFAQAPAIEWQNTIGGSGIDYLFSAQQTADGGYILGGGSASYISGDKTENNTGAVVTKDYWVIKLNNSGVIEWQNDIGGISDDVLRCIQQTSDGGYILGGYSMSNISGDKTEASMGYYDYWVIKLNSIGIIEWQNTIGGSDYDFLFSVQQTADGGYILGGHSDSGISGDKTGGNMGGGVADYWVIKLNSLGAIQWQNTIGGNNEDILYSIEQTNDGGYILGGASLSSLSGDKTEEWLGSYDFWVIKLDGSGVIQWQNTIGGSSLDYLTVIHQTMDGGYILGGRSSSGISGDKNEASFGGMDFWVVKINSSGIIEWQKTIGGAGADDFWAIQQTPDGGYVIGGNSTSGISGNKTEASFGGKDYWVVKINSFGEILWQKTIGGSGNDDAWSIANTADGGYLIGGYSTSNISGNKTEASLGNEDYWVVKLASDCANNPEICNGVDDNCNGLIDDSVFVTISTIAGDETTFCQGGSVILTAMHTGASLQWKKNGLNIAGATSTTYTATKNGDYTCVTTSACGSATSIPITIVVNKTPTASITAGGPTTFCVGGSVTLTEVPVGGCSYQWYKGPAPISGATSTTYIATTAGYYKCRVTKVATGCSKNSNGIYVSVPCREGNQLEANVFSIYPNPANDFITIQTDFTTEKTIYLTNALGQILQTLITSENNITINLNNVSSGVYFIKMEDGINSVTEKFVKQ